MDELKLTPEQREHLHKDAINTAYILSDSSDEEISRLLAQELQPFSQIVMGIQLVSEMRGWNEAQVMKAILYAVLRQRRATLELAEI